MASDYPLLDQLETEINRVLEQTGRIFAASNKLPETAPVAQVIGLKQMLPASLDRFHHALDQLEDELQMAKLVMRRDLAVCRERTGISQPAPAIAVAEDTDPTALESAEQISQPNEGGEGVSAGDIPMTDLEPEAPTKVEVDEGHGDADQEPVEEATKNEKLAPAHTEESNIETIQTEKNPNPADATLQVDTKPKLKETTGEDNQAPDEDKQPDTGTFSNTNDLDSLFGGPTSAGPEFNMDNDATDFDFTSFGNDVNNDASDNDNLSALLPGLQDYANNQPGGSGEPDFDALFSTNNDGQDGPGENQDTTFDDLMNFTDFGTGDFTGGNTGGDGSGNNADQDFDFSFD